MLRAWGARSRRASSSSAPPPLRSIRDILAAGASPARVAVHGWVRTARLQKRFGFLEVNDGSCAGNLQVVWPAEGGAGGGLPDAAAARALTTGAAVRVGGVVVASPKPGQPVELAADALAVVSGADAASYPLQKKTHSPEFLRSGALHLRARGAAAGAVLRARGALSAALHAHFAREGLLHVHTPVLTANDCEGAGELFGVAPAGGAGGHFFGRPVFLTVSGQLHLEAFAQALSRVYAFGPTFRAERSNTTRHLAEFWMVEPEIAPARLPDALALAEAALGAAARALAPDDAALLAREHAAPDLAARLARAAAGGFERLTYTDALARLRGARAPAFERAPPEWGGELAGEHERWLAADAGAPLFVTHYPAALKPFYMALDEADAGAAAAGVALAATDARAANAARLTVANFDLLVPGLGELAGGSAREARADVLRAAMAARGLLSPAAAAAPAAAPRAPADAGDGTLDWYLDLRRYGGVESAGFGMGFERLVAWATGVENVRDAIPIPRVVGSCRM